MRVTDLINPASEAVYLHQLLARCCSRTHAKKSPLSASGFLERLDIGHIVRKFQSLAFLTILLLLIILAILLL